MTIDIEQIIAINQYVEDPSFCRTGKITRITVQTTFN